MNTLLPGTRVRRKSDGRTGVVNYVRMAPPDYSKPEVYSVYLDHTLRASYSGTLINANDLEVIPQI